MNSCKKDQKDVRLSTPTASGTFASTLYNELVAYDKEHPIIDSIALAGKIDWAKIIARLSSNASMPVNFDFPIVGNGSECTQTLEFSFTKEKNWFRLKSENHKLR